MVHIVLYNIMLNMMTSNNVDHSRLIYFLLSELNKYDKTITFESDFDLIDVYDILDDKSKKKLLSEHQIVRISNIRRPKETRLLPKSFLEILKENGINSKYNFKARPDLTCSNIEYEFEEIGDYITLGVRVTIISSEYDTYEFNNCYRRISIGYKALKNDVCNPINGLIIGE
jgi:hypothetical protein